MGILASLLIFMAFIGHSSASYCVCKDGGSDSVLQKALDYACGAGADCSPILQSGACYQPNTVKDHCSYAVNSYYQKKNQASGTCDFAGAATVSSTPPTTVASTCVYPSSSSSGTNTSTTPSTTNTTTTPIYNPGISPTGLDPSDGSILNRSMYLLFLCMVLTIFGFSSLTLV